MGRKLSNREGAPSRAGLEAAWRKGHCYLHEELQQCQGDSIYIFHYIYTYIHVHRTTEEGKALR